MGNTMELKLKEDRPYLEITETLVGKFKEHISMADHSMAGLAKSMDAMRDACELLLRELDKNPQLQDETTVSDTEKVNSQELARHLLEMIDTSVSDHKYVVIESLGKLFECVWDVGKSCIENTENSSFAFLVDKYKADLNADEVGVSFTDCQVKSLQREIKYLQDTCSSFKKEVSNLNIREVQYRKEIKVLEDENEALRKRIEDLTKRQTLERKAEKECSDVSKDYHEKSFDSGSEDSHKNQVINELKEKNASLLQKLKGLENDAIATKHINEQQVKSKCGEIDNLKHELEILRNKTQSISQSEGDGESLTADLEVLSSETDKKETKLKEEISTFKDDQEAMQTNKVLQCLEYNTFIPIRAEISSKKELYQTITTELLSFNIDLKISEWSPSQSNSVPTDKIFILPIYIYTTRALKQKMSVALTKMPVGSNIAIVVLYSADRLCVRKEMESGEPAGTEFKQLGGVFKFGYSSSGYLKRELNEKSFNAFLQFLKGKSSTTVYISR